MTGGASDQWALADYGAPKYLGLLAELETASGNAEGALPLIREGLATAQEGGQHIWDARHRLRGDILLKRDPGNPLPAEETYKTAIAVAKEQGAVVEVSSSLASR